MASRNPEFYVDRALAAATAGFTTKTAQQDALADLNRAYDGYAEAIKAPYLAQDCATRTAEQDKMYWDLPYQLNNWRAKHGALAVAAYPGTAELVSKVNALFKLREQIKAQPVVKAAKLDKADPAAVAAADKTQTRGNCPCCGREQAVLASGRMSKHGYTVEHNWFNGVCDGERYAPMQVQREVTDAIVAQVRADVAAIEARVDDLIASREVLKRVRKPGEYVRRGAEPTMVDFASLDFYQQRDTLIQFVCTLQSRASAGKSFARDMEKLVNAVHGQPLKVVAL